MPYIREVEVEKMKLLVETMQEINGDSTIDKMLIRMEEILEAYKNE